MGYQVQDSPFFAPGSIEYLDASGVAIPAANVVASSIRVRWADLVQVVTFNSDGKPLSATSVTKGT